MKKSWQKILAILCAMTLVLTGLLSVSLAEEVSAAETEADVQPAAEAAEEAPAVSEEVQPASESAAVPVAAEAPAQPAEDAAAPVVETPAQPNAAETAPAVEMTPAEAAPVAETPAQEETVNEAAPAEETPVTEEAAEVPSVTEVSEETQEEETQTEAAAEEATDEAAAASEVNPVTEETVPAEETTVYELIPVDMTVETLSEAYGVVTADRPCMIRLISSTNGKVKVTVAARSPLYVQFGNEAGEIISEHSPDEDGNVTFSFGAEYGRSVLLYVWSIGMNEDGTVIESVPFHISSEKVEPVHEESLDEYDEPEEANQTEDTVPATENAESAAEAPAAVGVRRVILSGEAGSSFREGETVHLSVSLEGFEDVNEYLIIWEVNHGEGWEEASRGANNFYSFPASAESLNAEYRVRVLFR